MGLTRWLCSVKLSINANANFSLRESPSFESATLPCRVCMCVVGRALLGFLVFVAGFSLSPQFSFCSLAFSAFLALPNPISTDVAYFKVFVLCGFEHLLIFSI